jgi:hypothetical protein
MLGVQRNARAARNVQWTLVARRALSRWVWFRYSCFSSPFEDGNQLLQV